MKEKIMLISIVITVLFVVPTVMMLMFAWIKYLDKILGL
jgi:hypothetical protein